MSVRDEIKEALRATVAPGTYIHAGEAYTFNEEQARVLNNAGWWLLHLLDQRDHIDAEAVVTVESLGGSIPEEIEDKSFYAFGFLRTRIEQLEMHLEHTEHRVLNLVTEGRQAPNVIALELGFPEARVRRTLEALRKAGQVETDPATGAWVPVTPNK